MANEHSQIVPSMQPTAKVADFKFWCQKVLPLVYDDSLSYYEVLNKMVVYLNQVIDNINADIDNVAELEDDFLLLQQYVNNFFDDIDQLVTYTERAEAAQTAAATSAINAASSASNAASSASNAASSSGSAATSALSALDAKNAAVAAKTAAETALANAQTAATNAAASAASALQNFQLSDAARVAAQSAETNAAQSAGSAADSADAAAASAAAVAKISGWTIDYDANKIIADTTWKHGSLLPDGSETTNANRLVSSFIKIGQTNGFIMPVTSGYSYMVQGYGENKAIIDGEWWISQAFDYRINPAFYYIRIVIKENSDGLVPTDVGEVTTPYRYYRTSNVTTFDNKFFVNQYTFLEDGTKTTSTGIRRLTTDYIDAVPLRGKLLSYGLYGVRDTTKTTNVISFFDSSKTYLSGVASSENSYINGCALVPQDACYMAASSMFASDALTPSYIEVSESTENIMPTTQVVNSQMSKSNFVSALNTFFQTYATTVKAKAYSFISISDTWTFEKIYEIVNKNFRSNVVSVFNSFDENCQAINAQAQKKIYRFMDARVDDSNEIRFSLNTQFESGEPSVIVSDDGETMYVYGYLKRISTKDGVTWTSPENLVLTGRAVNLLHVNVNYIDGKYYLIGCNTNSGGHLWMYESDDGLNFTEVGIIKKENAVICGDTVRDWGNTYLIKDAGSGTYYLYVEYVYTGVAWRIGILTATNLTSGNEDGTVGNWVSEESAAITAPWTDLDNRAIGSTPVSSGGIPAGAGKPNFAKGEDNRPIKHDGKYYMYFHSTADNKANIMRGYSYDLKTWVTESVILDNRDTPTAGDNTSGNADHCIIQFKGRTYLFYSWNINSTNTHYIKYTIDDRPIHEVLSIRP